MAANGSDEGGNLRVGPTDQAMVRIEITADDGTAVALDFDADEAEAIADELRAAAEIARKMAEAPARGSRR